jgi:nucleoside 2-deoxyribosyltransferase/SAM-dependent methyltransferase
MAMKIYWANAMFVDADRRFNEAAKQYLVQQGFDVILPQETATNRPDAEPSCGEVFRNDNQLILNSDVVVAVLDAEAIDSGVAAEIGLAHANGLPVIGLYTDIRQFRHGAGRMYKNLYVLGLVEHSGGMATSLVELAAKIRKLEQGELKSATPTGLPPADFDAHLSEIESLYSPAWSCYDAISQELKGLQSRVISDFGCGTGKLAQHLTEDPNFEHYIGYDVNEQFVAYAADKYATDQRLAFAGSFAEFKQLIARGRPRALVASFVIHDLQGLDPLREVLDAMPSDSFLLIWDLAVDDLPRLTSALLTRLGNAHCSHHDCRFGFRTVLELTSSLGVSLVDLRTLGLTISFPDSSTLSRYLNAFQISLGYDLPLSRLQDHGRRREALQDVVHSMQYPFRDTRTFVRILARKPER